MRVTSAGAHIHSMATQLRINVPVVATAYDLTCQEIESKTPCTDKDVLDHYDIRPMHLQKFYIVVARLYGYRVFFPQRQLTSFEHYVNKTLFIVTNYRR